MPQNAFFGLFFQNFARGAENLAKTGTKPSFKKVAPTPRENPRSAPDYIEGVIANKTILETAPIMYLTFMLGAVSWENKYFWENIILKCNVTNLLCSWCRLFVVSSGVFLTWCRLFVVSSGYLFDVVSIVRGVECRSS